MWVRVDRHLAADALALRWRCVVAAAVSQLKMQGDFSDAVPFLKRPINLDGEYAGDVGFDPLVSSCMDLTLRGVSYTFPLLGAVLLGGAQRSSSTSSPYSGARPS